MLVDKTELGFGKRSWRYSMLVNDGVIEKMFIEPEKPGDPFEVSDADTMLDYINPKAKKPDQVAILTREGCGFCAKAKKLLKELGYAVRGSHARPQRPLARRRRDHRPRHRAAGVRQRPAHRRPGGARALGRRKPPDCSARCIIGDELARRQAPGQASRRSSSAPSRKRGLRLAWAQYLGDEPARLTAALQRSLSPRATSCSASAASARRRTTTRGSAPPRRSACRACSCIRRPSARSAAASRRRSDAAAAGDGRVSAGARHHSQPGEPHPGLLAARAPLRAGLSADGLADGRVGARHALSRPLRCADAGARRRCSSSRRAKAS